MRRDPVTPFDIREHAARDLHALGDHLHSWEDEGPAVKMAYRLQVGLVMARTITREHNALHGVTVPMPPPVSFTWHDLLNSVGVLQVPEDWDAPSVLPEQSR